MKQGGHDSQQRPTNPVVATSQREMREQLPPPSTSAGLQRRAKELPQVRRPPTGTGGSPPLVRIADTPNVSGLSGRGGRRGFPRHRLTTSTRASGTPVPSTTSASRPISELAGVLEFLPRNVAESPSTRTKRLPLGPKEVTREHLFDFREEFSGQLLEPESQEKKSDISMKCETRGRFDPLSKPGHLTQEQPAAVNPRLVPTPQKVVSSEELQRVLPRTSTTTSTTTTRRIDVPRHIRNSSDTSLPRLPPHIESRVPATSRLTLPKPGIRRKPEQDAGQVMGDVACYGVWKTEIEVCTTANSQRTYNDGVPARTGSSTTLLEDSREDELTGKRRRSELVSSKTTGMFQNPSKKLQPEEFTGSSEMALIGGFEDLSGGTYVLPDDHALELTVDITQRQRASAVAPSEGSSSLSSFKKRVSAAVTVHRGTRPVNIKPQQARLEPIFSEPSKAPEESPVREPQPIRKETLKKPQKPKEPENDVEYGWPVDYERFLPHSREALSYTELLEYPKKPRKASTKRDVSLSQFEAQDEQGVSPPMEEFVLDSAPVVPSTRRVSASKPIGPSKGKTAPQPDKTPTSKAASRHSRGSLDGVNQEQATSSPHTKQVENKVGKNQRRSSTPKSPSTDRGEDISAPLTSKGSDVSSMKGSATSHSPRRRSIAAEESNPTVSSSRRISSLIPTPPSATKNVDKKAEMTQKQSPAPERPNLAHDEDIPSRSLSQGRGAPSQKGSPELDSQDRRSTADPQQKPTTSPARRASPSKPIGPSNRQTTPPTAAKQVVLWLKKEPEETTSSVSPTTHPILKIYYCSSDVCNAEAAYLKSLISKSIKPCDNFYEYVCEGWTKSHAIPGEGAGAGLSMDTLLQDRLASDVEPTLLGIPDADVKTAAALHEDCMRRDKVGHDGDTVVNVARELFQAWAIKEWPIFKGKTITHSTAWLFAGELVRDLNVAALATVGVGVSPKVLEATAIELDEPRLVFSCNDASRPAVTKLFKDALMEVMSRFAAASATIGSGDVDDVLGVFTRLASSPAIAASPDTSPLVYTNVKLIELDTGFKNFLEGVFNSIVTIDGTTEVVLKSPDYLRNHLPAAMQELSPHAVVNYLGFMALVKAAPFFPERFSSLRQIFGKDVLGRTLPDVSQTKTLCLLAVQQVLPACFAKAAVKLRGMSRTDLPLTEWLSRLESSFGRHQERVAWINELSALIVRYRLKRNRRVAFSSRHEACAPSPQEIPRRSEHPLRFFHQVSMLQEQKRLQLVLKSGQEVLALRGEARTELATIPEYDVMRQAVHVPMALFNTSVASNTTMFSFHLSRVAVRLYRALVQILFPRNIYERDAPLALTDETLRRLDELLSCFEKDLRVLPATLRGPVSVDSAKFRGALLQHAAAVKLGFRAFRDHLTVRRVWQVDFRFKDLPEFSSDALFFLYYALDNCESADTVYAEHQGTWMPAHYRVNAALRHVKEFAEPFSCSDGDQMALSAQMCHVLKKD
ncbi:hypothetical protein V5799_007297 [Amblyomma americanum]|uniref:M13 family peptidase n=1 Tax=Amblyomma americanum TaxID=6943 RepID=A0AAQ4DTY0_AMBAM